LFCRARFGVGDVVETGGRDFRGKPIGFREAEGKWDKVKLDLFLGQLLADFVERLDSLVER